MAKILISIKYKLHKLGTNYYVLNNSIALSALTIDVGTGVVK